MERPSVVLNLKITPRVAKRLAESAKRFGYSSREYAQLLFEAGFAARVGQERGLPPADRELDDQVSCVMALAGKMNTSSMAKAIGIPEARCVRILDGIRQYKQGSAAL